MGQVRVESFAISLDGYGAGPDQDINHGLGMGGEDLHQLFIPTHVVLRRPANDVSIFQSSVRLSVRE